MLVKCIIINSFIYNLARVTPYITFFAREKAEAKFSCLWISNLPMQENNKDICLIAVK